MPNNWTVDDIHDLANDILLQSQGGDVSPDLSGYMGVYNTGIDKEAYASGNPIEIFSDINQIPVIKLLIVPKQEGSGTPSSTNVRPITGWDNFILSVNDTEKEISTDSAGTVYGGTLNVNTGLLTVDRAIVEGTSENIRRNSGTQYYINPGNAKITGSSYGKDAGLLSNQFFPFEAGMAASRPGMCFVNSGGAIRFNTTESYATVGDLLTALGTIQFVYPIASPQIYQLTPTEVNLIAGENVITTDSPNTLEVTYKIRS